ncbi:MAG TPA: glutathione S-transferase N-terminal domain-containing protein [Gemmatimonadota bacterium]|nr:glutathione S-transferase N-terminal domain-containing protein [Gemmatimonadota bacterium]
MAKLYALRFSHPAIAARLMLERAGIEHEVVDLPMGFHPLFLKRAGFAGATVPALVLDGRKIQGSLEISRAIEARGPAGILFPIEAAARQRVEEAERWAEAELQPIPRRLFRWALARDAGLRQRAARMAGLPLPRLAGALMRPLAARFARVSRADDASVRTDIERLPALLDRVDGWIADGTIGAREPNAADFQIGTTVRAMLAMEDLKPEIEGRPAADLAARIVPDYPGRLPPVLPPGWRQRTA